MAWPIVTWQRPDGSFVVTTSIALPQKAFNVRRTPEVAMLFSDATASGLTDPPQILVQGTASCPDEIVTDVSRAARILDATDAAPAVQQAHSARSSVVA